MHDPICGCLIAIAALRRDLELYEVDLLRAQKELAGKSKEQIAASVRWQAVRLVAGVCERRIAEIRADIAEQEGEG